MRRSVLILSAVLPLLMPGAGARADDGEVQRLRDQLRAATLRVRDLQDQLATAPPPAATPPRPAPVRVGAASTDGELRAARQAAAKAGVLRGQLAKAQAETEALKAAAAGKDAELDKVKTAFAKTADQLAAANTEHARMTLELASLTNRVNACQGKNQRLIAFSEQLLADFRKVGLGDVLGSRDPIVGFKRVQLENIAQDREDKIRGNRCDPRFDAAPTTKKPGG